MEIHIIEERPVNRIELKEKLEQIKKEQELGFRSNKTCDYLAALNKHCPVKSVAALKKQLQELEITRLKDKHIEKLIDLYPQDAESVKAILSGEAVTLKNEEIEKMLECFK